VSPGQECRAAGMLDELVLIVPPQHTWAKRRDIALRLLADMPLLVREDGSATRSVTERALQRAGVKFRVAMELDHTEAIKQGVMAGLAGRTGDWTSPRPPPPWPPGPTTLVRTSRAHDAVVARPGRGARPPR
jgi:DNA-binding transcriptional LysR family regulator